MSATISLMYKRSGGSNPDHKCNECIYYAASGFRNEYVCKRQGCDDPWKGNLTSCLWFDDGTCEDETNNAGEETTAKPEDIAQSKNQIAVANKQLPDNLYDLNKFVLIGREKLIAVRAEIRAIEKVDLAKEVLQQKREEAQEIAEAVLDAETRMGELLKEIPKATKGTGSNQYAKNAENRSDTNFCKAKAKLSTEVEESSDVNTRKPKSEVLQEAGISKDQASQYQTLAANTEAVAEAKAEARENDEIVTRTAALKKVKEKKNNSDNKVAKSTRGNEEKTKEKTAGVVSETSSEKTNVGLSGEEAQEFLLNLAYAVNVISEKLESLINELKNSKLRIEGADIYFGEKGGTEKTLQIIRRQVDQLLKGGWT